MQQRMSMVLFFAAARDVTKVDQWTLMLSEPTSVALVRELVLAEFPALKPWSKALRIAIDGEYAREDFMVEPGSEIALIPPVAGGC